jgi:prepilin-type N-terminal cleavage/methylation domain-containing protein
MCHSSRFSALRRGFSMIEILIVMVVIAGMLTFAYPRFSQATELEAIIGARREVVAQVSRARSTAAQRGCRTQLHFRADTDRVWVTACRTTGTGMDTVGTISDLRARYNVDFGVTADSIGFGPTSIGLATAPINMTFTRGVSTRTMVLSSVGRPSW